MEIYLADFRFDTGIRIRPEPISPTLTCNLRSGGGMSNGIYLIEVEDEDTTSDKARIFRDNTRGGVKRELSRK